LTTLSAPTPARLNLTLVEHAARLSTAKATKAIVRVDIDMFRFLALD
jgi:hypothetical protein